MSSGLFINEIRLPKGGEWRPQIRGWCLCHTDNGIGYWQEQKGMREISAGSVLVFPDSVQGTIRASQLNEVRLAWFTVETGKLLGLLSVPEQHFFGQAAQRGAQAVRMFPPDDSISDRVKSLRHDHSPNKAGMRLRLLQVFLDAFEIDQAAVPTKEWKDGRERLKQIMNQMAASDFVEMSISDLAPMVPCSPRHLNRLFQEELGTSFRDKQIELRLAKACLLLSSSDAKVVDVALESGYQSSSVFSGLFKKHLGLSPGQWRRQGLKLGAASRSP